MAQFWLTSSHSKSTLVRYRVSSYETYCNWQAQTSIGARRSSWSIFPVSSLCRCGKSSSHLWRKAAKLVEYEKCYHGDRFSLVAALIDSVSYDSDDIAQGLMAAIGAPSTRPHHGVYIFFFTSISPGNPSENAWVGASECCQQQM